MGKLTEDWRRAHKDQIESAQKALERCKSTAFKKNRIRKQMSEIGSENTCFARWMGFTPDWRTSSILQQELDGEA